jgi:hypothetical protein
MMIRKKINLKKNTSCSCAAIARKNPCRSIQLTHFHYIFLICWLTVTNFYFHTRSLDSLEPDIFENHIDTSKLALGTSNSHTLGEKDIRDRSRALNEYDHTDSLKSTNTNASMKFDPNGTGSWAECKKSEIIDTTTSLSSSIHDDERSTIVSCHTVFYRIKKSSFPLQVNNNIIIGVLSASGGEGPQRRQSIRETWANGGTATSQKGIFFLVAGPWDDIAQEYEEMGDLIWINVEGINQEAESMSTYKTQSFVRIVHDMSKELELVVDYIFKTDDDSYVNVEALKYQLMESKHAQNQDNRQDQPRDYWGFCKLEKNQPERGGRWALSYEVYPEPMLPQYCKGAGYAMSRKFIECASDNEHISKTRYMPLEDISMGLIAERCGIKPTMIENRKWINLFRTGLAEERRRERLGLPKIERSSLSAPQTKGTIVQHHIYDYLDMKEYHKAVHKDKIVRRKFSVRAHQMVRHGSTTKEGRKKELQIKQKRRLNGKKKKSPKVQKRPNLRKVQK